MIRTKAVVKYLGYILLFNSLFLLISAAISFVNKENALNALLISAVSCTVLGITPQLFIRKYGEISFHEGLVISVFGWIITCVVGMLPYYLFGG